MSPKSKRSEFFYPGVSQLKYSSEDEVIDHRNYIDFVGPTVQPVPVVGGFERWLYCRFVS